MNCAWLKDLTNYDCRIVRAIDGTDAIEVVTPFTLLDGSPLLVYLVDQGNHVIISDNGDTLAHLSAGGADIQRGIGPIRRALKRHGVGLAETGAFEATAPRSKLPAQFSRYMQAVVAIDEAERNRLDKARSESKLLQEALRFIQARRPSASIELRVPIIGASNATHIFDVQLGHELIDVIGPKPQATGAEMRKVSDILNGPFSEGLSPLIIVDDRIDFAAARQEVAILLSISNAMTFSDLAQPRH